MNINWLMVTISKDRQLSQDSPNKCQTILMDKRRNEKAAVFQENHTRSTRKTQSIIGITTLPFQIKQVKLRFAI